MKEIDLGAGHASAKEYLWPRILGALKSNALLNDSVGAGYLDRNWPPALKSSGAWPLTSLRQSFLNGALTRLLDVDAVLQHKLAEFVERGDFGLASRPKPDGTYARLWFAEPVNREELAFEEGVFLLTKIRAKALREVASKPTPKSDGSPDYRLAPQAKRSMSTILATRTDRML